MFHYFFNGTFTIGFFIYMRLSNNFEEAARRVCRPDSYVTPYADNRKGVYGGAPVNEYVKGFLPIP